MTVINDFILKHSISVSRPIYFPHPVGRHGINISLCRAFHARSATRQFHRLTPPFSRVISCHPDPLTWTKERVLIGFVDDCKLWQPKRWWGKAKTSVTWVVTLVLSCTPTGEQQPEVCQPNARPVSSLSQPVRFAVLSLITIEFALWHQRNQQTTQFAKWREMLRSYTVLYGEWVTKSILGVTVVTITVRSLRQDTFFFSAIMITMTSLSSTDHAHQLPQCPVLVSRCLKMKYLKFTSGQEMGYTVIFILYIYS